MGFFSGISSVLGGLSGAAGGAKQSSSVPGSGFYTMPQEYQDLYTGLLKQASSTVLPGGNLNTEMFRQLPQTSQETNALGMIDRGIGSQQNFQSNLQMLMNPYDDYVINDINRQSMGQNSLVNQNANMAGQMGSNRQFLGSSDVEANRLGQIGQFRQGQYNNAVNQALGPQAALQQQDITNLLASGEFQRGMDANQRQAPYLALQGAQGALNGFPLEFGSQRQGGTTSSGSSLGSALGTAGRIAGLIGNVGGSLFGSDRRLKWDIELVGEENGHNIYSFRYHSDPSGRKYIGVMADEVSHIPNAVIEDISGYKKVNYDVVGVKFREAA